VSPLKPGDPDWGWEFHLEDFVIARLADERGAAERLADPGERAAALVRNDALRLLAALHTIYVEQEDWGGKNWARCYSCEVGHGVPCSTLCNLAMLWAGHPAAPWPLEMSPRSEQTDLLAAGSWRRLNWPHTVPPNPRGRP
jgi:hypothetical protein